MHRLAPAIVNPDQQPPMPSPAADAYAHTVMSWAQRPLPEDVVAAFDIPYGVHAAQRCNVFAPRGAQAAPVLVFWHGGGWTNGYRDYVTFMAAQVVRLGMVLVAPSYRLVTQERLPAALEDCLALLRHLTEHAARWGAAPDRLYLSGHSAGGHLAALAALRVGSVQGSTLPGRSVRGCLPISAIMDLHHPEPLPGSLEERVYTMVLSQRDDDAALSPLCWTRGNEIPFVMSCGEFDSDRVVRSNRRMHALLRLQKGPASLHVESGLDHFSTHTELADANHAWYTRLARLVRETG